MPKLKARITVTTADAHSEICATTYIIEAPTVISAMAKFSAAANTMPYTGRVTDEPAGDSSGKDS